VDYTGMTLEESYGHGWNKPFHPDDQQRAWEAWQNAVQHDATYSLECRLRRADGTYRWWLIRGVPQRDADGKVWKWFGTCTDIEEIKQAEQARRQSEDKFAKAFHGTPDAIIISRLSDGRVVEVNDGFTQLSGYTREEVLASSTIALQLWATPADRERCIALLRHDGKVSGLEFAFRNRAGAFLECRYSGTIIEVNGEAHTLSLIHDLTEQHRAAAAVKTSEALLRNILNNMQDAYVRTGADGRFVMVNPAAVRMYGYDSVEEMIGLPAAVLYAESANREALFEELHRAGYVNDRVGLGRRKDGSTLWVSLSAHFYRDAAGNVIGSEGFMRDITERKQAAEALRESEERYRTLFDRANEGICLLSANGDLVSVNESYARMHGYRVEEMLPRNLQALTAPETTALVPAQLRRLLEPFGNRSRSGRACSRIACGTIPWNYASSLLNFQSEAYPHQSRMALALATQTQARPCRNRVYTDVWFP
jgi:PAS domain S-box-containing protein